MTAFHPAMLDGLDEPVQRYLRHAIADDAPTAGRGVQLTMSGRIRVGLWLPFTGTERCDGRSFVWRAKVGRGLLLVTDRFGGGTGSTTGRLLGRAKLFEAADADTARSAAGRAALEAIWTPGDLLPGTGVAWRAESDDVIVASRPVPPEHPEVRLRIDPRGGLLSAWAQRWRGASGYQPCGCEVHEERRFGRLVVPSAVTVSWGFGTSDERPFFSARIERLAELVGAGPVGP